MEALTPDELSLLGTSSADPAHLVVADLTPRQVDVLVEYGSPRLRPALAQHVGRATQRRIFELAKADIFRSLERLASNPDLEPSIQDSLLDELVATSTPLENLARNPSLVSTVAKRIIRDFPEYTQQVAENCRSYPVELVDHSDVKIRAALAANPALTGEHQLVLLQERTAQVRGPLARRHDLLPEVEATLEASGSPLVLRTLAANSTLSKATFDRLYALPPARGADWHTSFSSRTSIWTLLAKSGFVTWNGSLRASFAWHVSREFTVAFLQSNGVAVEFYGPLLSSWEGTLDDLVTAARLVER